MDLIVLWNSSKIINLESIMIVFFSTFLDTNNITQIQSIFIHESPLRVKYPKKLYFKAKIICFTEADLLLSGERCFREEKSKKNRICF